MSETLPFEDLERSFDLIAEAIDTVGPEQERLFLAKLALALAHRLGSLAEVQAAVAEAKRDLEG